MPAKTDAELLSMWRKGKTAAGEDLFERYFGKIERFFISKMPNGVSTCIVEDLMQETFSKCLEGCGRLESNEKFRSFLFAIAYHVLIDHLRRQYRRNEFQHLAIEECAIAEIRTGPVTAAMRGSTRNCLRQLPLKYQTVLELHYWEDMHTGEIAEVLQVPVGTVRSQLRRGRQLLSEILGRPIEQASA